MLEHVPGPFGRGIERLRASDGGEVSCVVVEAATLGSLRLAWEPYAAGNDVAVAVERLSAEQRLAAREILAQMIERDDGSLIDAGPLGVDDRGSTFVVLTHGRDGDGDDDGAGDREPRDRPPSPMVGSIERRLDDDV